MRGIREERLKVLKKQYKCSFNDAIFDYLIKECHELQEPWMTLDEFLKSGFEGQCWVHSTDGEIFECHFNEDDFMTPEGYVNFEHITHVMPIHKPEPPR